MLTNSRIIKAAAKGVLTRARIIGGGGKCGCIQVPDTFNHRGLPRTVTSLLGQKVLLIS